MSSLSRIARYSPRASASLCLPSLVIPNYGPRGTVAEPVAVAKHARPVVVVMAVEEFERLKSKDTSKTL